MRSIRTRHALLTLPLSVMLGCAESPSPEPDAAPAEATAAVVETPATVEQEIINVTLTEGTNLAVTVTDDGARRVLALQGQLFLEEAGAVRPLTDPYYDARGPQIYSTGERVVFHGYANGNWDVWQVDVASGEVTALTTGPFDDREPQYSPDGTTLAFSSDRGGSYDIWIRDAEGDLSQFTTTDGNASSPSWSSDGSSIAYALAARDGNRVMVTTRDGDTRTLASGGGLIAGVSWFPDLSAVAYQERLVEDGRNVTRLVSVDTATGERTTHTEDDADVFPFRTDWIGADTMVFAADGLVMRKTTVAEAADVWPFAIEVALTRDRYERRPRSYDSNEDRRALGIRGPQITEDGSTVYFTALGDLWRWQPADQALTRLTDDPYAEISFALSPDESEIALVSDRSGKPALYVMDLETSTVEHIDIPSDGVSGPRWSPDGARIAVFTAVPTNPLGAQIVVVDRRDGSQKPLLTPMPEMSLSWSNDGEHVAIARLNPYSSRYREGVYELVVANADDGTMHTIVPTQHRSIRDAVLAPDGSMTYTQGGILQRLELDANLQALESGGAITTELTDTPAWSAGGSHLVYQNGSGLRRMNAASGRIDDITPPLTYRLDEPDETYIVRAGRVFTGETDEYLEDVDIRIERGRIAAIGPIADQGDLSVVDATDHVVIPGLFEMHAHMGATSEVQGRTWLAFGVTTVRDPGTDPYSAKETQEAWDSGRRVGPRTHVTSFLTDGNRVYYSMAEGIVSDSHLDLALQRIERLELDFIKTYVRLPDHWQRHVVRFAHELGIPVSSHELYPAVAHGMDHVEHIGGTSRRGYQPKVTAKGRSYDDVVTLLAASGMGITPTAVLPGFAVIALDEPDWFETPQFDHFYGEARKMAYRMMAGRFGGGAAGDTAVNNGHFLRELIDRDALVVSGTDSPFVPYGAGLHAELRLYSRAGLTPAEILDMATMKAAKAAGVQDELGSISAGKLADLVILDGDPLADIRDADNVVMTIKNGRRYPLADLLRLPE